MKIDRLKSFFSSYGITIAATISLILGVVISGWGQTIEHGSLKPVELFVDFYANMGTELIGIAITVLVLDRLYQQRQAKLEEQHLRVELLNKVRSQVNDQARLALEQLISSDLLFNGSLEGENFSNGNLHQSPFISFHRAGSAKLRGANFRSAILSEAWLNEADLSDSILKHAKIQKAHLYKTNMQNADLVNTDLDGAYLFKADLRNTSMNNANVRNASFWETNLFNSSLSDIQLRTAFRLRGSILPEGSRYNGRFNLVGDIQDAEEDGTDTEDPKAMAAWYVVPLEEHLRGQEWARKHLPKMQEGIS